MTREDERPPVMTEDLSARRLAQRYVGVLLDLDGVCYRGTEPIPGAADAIDRLRAAGVGIRFVTNNSTRTPEAAADHLGAVGITAPAHEIVTSPQAAADLLDPGTRCLVIGMAGVRAALTDRGCALSDDPHDVDALVVGMDTDLTWGKLCAATIALDRGVRFIGTNGDVSFPSSEGLWPGNGAVLAALTAATGRMPVVAGKPHPPLLQRAAHSLPEGPVLMIGDRIDTDIVGAQALGWDTLLVLSGISTATEARAMARPPTWLAHSLAAITP
jgi:glycerol-1-phosphatase